MRDYNSHQLTVDWKSPFSYVLFSFEVAFWLSPGPRPLLVLDTTPFPRYYSTPSTHLHRFLLYETKRLALREGTQACSGYCPSSLLPALTHAHLANQVTHPSKAVVSLVGVLLIFFPDLSQADNTVFNCATVTTLWGLGPSLSHLCTSSQSIQHEARHTVDNSICIVDWKKQAQKETLTWSLSTVEVREIRIQMVYNYQQSRPREVVGHEPERDGQNIVKEGQGLCSQSSRARAQVPGVDRQTETEIQSHGKVQVTSGFCHCFPHPTYQTKLDRVLF